MNRTGLAGLMLALVMILGPAMAEVEPPIDWIDAKSGHRVVRLSREPGSASLYFHQYPYSADGKKLVFTAPSGIWTVDLETHELQKVVAGQVGILLTSRKSGDVFYIRRSGHGGLGGGDVYAANLDTLEERHVAKLPEAFGGGGVCVNADETLLVGIGNDPDGTAVPRIPPDGRFEGRLLPGWSSGSPRLIYTLDVATGDVNVIHRSNEWLNHLQCSPTDPHQILFCHEGPWHFVDRTWLIRTDGTDLTQVHPRTMDMEIGGHEFFSNDGKSVWYDLQTPRSLVFWLAGYEIETGKRKWYHHERDEWSVHYNISPDGKLFAGDGGGPESVANKSPSGDALDPPGNGMWIYLFRPEPVKMTGLPERAAKQVTPAVFRSERLVDMSNHDYHLEPNVTFTPDGKWVVFRSNMHGPSHVYAVEVAKAK